GPRIHSRPPAQKRGPHSMLLLLGRRGSLAGLLRPQFTVSAVGEASYTRRTRESLFMEDAMMKLARCLLVMLAVGIAAGAMIQARPTTSGPAMQQDRTDVFFIVGLVKMPGRYIRKE